MSVRSRFASTPCDAALDTGEPVVDGADVRVARGAGVVEWWSSLPRGLEHGATLASRLAGQGALRVEVAVAGDLSPRAARDGAVALVDASGATRASYGELVAFDATRAELPATLAVEHGRIVLGIDDAHARYPLAIDPLVVTYDGILEAPLSPSPPVGAALGLAMLAALGGARRRRVWAARRATHP